MSDLSRTILSKKRIAIIGNGFDLALDAKTRYSDFYECLKRCFESQDIGEFENYYLHDGNKSLVESFFKRFKENQDNYFVNYFLNYKKVFGNWVDFESELSKIIRSLDRLVTALNEPSLFFIKHSVDFGERIFVKIADDLDLMQVLNVLSKCKYFKIYFDIFAAPNINERGFLFKFKDIVFNNRYDLRNALEEFSENFPFLLYDDLTIFSDLFSLYLGMANDDIRMDLFIPQLYKCEYFINYNYTPYLEMSLINNDFKDNQIAYINGSAENSYKEPKDKIVFGVDSNIKFKNNRFEIFTKRIQRSIKNTDVSHLGYIFENEISEIFIFGHSLSLADLESLRYIFEKSQKEILPTINVYYLDKKSLMNLVINLKIILGEDSFDKFQKHNLLKFHEADKAWSSTI